MILLALAACSETGLVKGTRDPGHSEDTAPEICTSYTGFHEVGQTWTYAFEADAAGPVGTITSELTRLDAEAVVVVEDRHFDYPDDSTLDIHDETTWRCDSEGAWILQSDYTSQRTSDTSDYESVGTTVYDPGWLKVPTGLGSGTTWSVDVDVIVTTDLYGDNESRQTGTYMVENREDLETGSGTLTTYEINGEGEMEGGTWTAHEYRAADVGLVSADDSVMLVEWSE